MIFILSNIFFGHPKLLKNQFDFFNDFNLNLLKSGSKDHKIIIRGDLFYNTKHTNFQLLIEVQKILKLLSQSSTIYILNNDYCFNLFKDYLNKIDRLEYDILDNISLFQSSKDDTNKIGYNIIKDGVKFIENKISPRFINYEINSLDDMDKIKITEDFIDITINSDLIEKPEFKNKIDIFLNNNSFNNIYYTEKTKNIEKINIKENNIRKILIDNIEEDLKTEILEVFNIYDEKK